jgi:hydrogenase/urease accessory protein HupE
LEGEGNDFAGDTPPLGERFEVRGSVGLALVGLLLAPGMARAHDPGLSAAEVQIRKGQLIARLSVAPMDAARLGDWQLLEVRADGRTLAPTAFERRVEPNDVRFELAYALPPAATVRLRVAAFDQLPSGHRQYLTLRDEDNKLLLEQILDAQAREIEIPRSAGDQQSRFRAFAALGVVHILTGYDHLLFLCGLLLTGGSLRSVAKIITSFTVAHSITLGAATFDLVQVPSRLVEPLIAATIIYVGIENIWRRGESDARWLLTFAFGLVHGFGFASALRELGIGAAGSAAAPLLSFNLGVEAGQFAVALVVLPVIWKLRARPRFVAHYVPACSLAVALVGIYWLVERSLLG